MKMKVILGDWSNDGHGMTEMFVVEIPHMKDRAEVGKFYKKGVEKLGFDLTKEVCREYENPMMRDYHYEILLDDGYVPYEFKLQESKYDEIPDYSEEEDVYITTELFLDIYMHFVSVGYADEVGSSKSFYYHVADDDMEQMRIGGYGLFSH